MFELRSDIRPEDIQATRRGRKASRKYPLHEMEVGQSFFVARANGKTLEATRAPVQAAISRFYREFPHRKYTTRCDREADGIRVFRLADRAPLAEEPEYPWDSLAVGDSFFAPDADDTSRDHLRDRLRAGALRASQRSPGRKFRVQHIASAGGFRVTRRA